jgi:hypothetical protein
MADNTAGSGIDLTQLARQQVSLAGVTSGGGFAVDPDAARQAARLCESYATDIADLLGHAALNGPPSLGSCWIANNLSEHFHNKAVGTTISTANVGSNVVSAAEPNSLAGQIAGIVNLMRSLGQLFGQAADNYTLNEQDVLGAVHKSGQRLG